MRMLLNAILIITCALLLLLIYSRWIEPNWLHVHTVEIAVPGLDPRLEGFTVLHLSDLHQSRFGPGQEKLLRAIGGQHYDMVALTGDVLSYPAGYNYAPMKELAAGLRAPVYYVYGNHDYPGHEALARELSADGITILANSWQKLPVADTVIQIAGIHDLYWTRHNPGSWLKTDLNAALEGTNPELFTLLLSHSPAILEEASAQGIPLILSGHTHGGQIKIPLLGAPTTGSDRLFDKYVQGLYETEGTRVYINRGLGTTGYPLRFLSRPEIVFIRLMTAN